jgi:hypothetical protein
MIMGLSNCPSETYKLTYVRAPRDSDELLPIYDTYRIRAKLTEQAIEKAYSFIRRQAGMKMNSARTVRALKLEKVINEGSYNEEKEQVPLHRAS